MPEERICHVCGTSCTEACPTCVENFKTRRKAEEMTGEEREKEVTDLLTGPKEVYMDMVLKRVEELVGRPVRTTELGFNPRLAQEARDRQ